MPTYHIEDGKLESFNKRLESMRRKLRKKGDTCTCKEIGVEYKKLSDGNTYKFHIMQVEGTVTFEGWNFIARIDHLNSGNVIKTISDIEIPNKYWHTEGYCDHCNTDRPRKTTYLVEKDGIICVNSGSISLPKENTAHSYLVIDESKIELKDIDGKVISEKEVR